MKTGNQASPNELRTKNPLGGDRKKEKRARHQACTRKPRKPKLVIFFERIIYLMVKDPDHKGRLNPTPLDPDCVDEYDLETIHLDDSKRRLKSLKKAKRKKRQEACRAFCQCGQLLHQPSVVWKLVLLIMLARVLDLFQSSMTGGVPIIVLTGIQSVPPVTKLLLQLVNGKPRRKKEGWSLCCPNVVELVRPIGSSAPSDDPYKYFGGKMELHYGEKSFWLPPQNMAVAIAPNCPSKIKNIILKEWMVSIPILCESPTKGRPVISLDGKSLQTVDPDSEIEQELKRWSPQIYGQLWCFFQWFRQKKHRWTECLEQAAQYRPTKEVDGRIYVAEDDESVILSLALSLFVCYLNYASKEGWLAEEEARLVFLEIWHAVLSESAKSVDQKGQDLEAITAAGFYTFLDHYLGPKYNRIASKDERCTKDSPAALRSIGNRDLLILPRGLTLQALCREYPGLGVDTTQSNWETTLQRALMEAGVELRTEGKDISWRYSFYPAGHAPKGVQTKLPCLGIPVDKLPNDILAHLPGAFGEAFGEDFKQNSSEPVAEDESTGDEA